MRDRSPLERDALALLAERAVPDDPSRFAAEIGALDLERLRESARRFGTPQYFLDVDRLRRRAAWFRDTFRAELPTAEFAYAFKCNDLPTQVRALREEGYHADVAGLFELRLALRMGFERILFSGPGKSGDELALALSHADRVTVNADNLDEIDRLVSMAGRGGATAAPEGEGAEAGPDGTLALAVGLRISTASTGGGSWSKFGMELDEVREAVRRIDACPGLEWAGVQFHGSWNKTPDGYVRRIERIASALLEIFPTGRLAALRFFDIGGGFYPEDQGLLALGEDSGIVMDLVGSRRGDRDGAFREAGVDAHAFRVTPVEPLDRFARDIGGALREHVLSMNPAMTVWLEPGRFLATFATTVLLRVVAVKPHGVVLDGGVNMLGDYRLAEYAFAPVVNVSRPSADWRRRLLFGSLCDPADLWGYSHYGDELAKGDFVAVLHQGAYTFSGAWRFIKSIPAYIAASGDELWIARREETFETRYAGCLM